MYIYYIFIIRYLLNMKQYILNTLSIYIYHVIKMLLQFPVRSHDAKLGINDERICNDNIQSVLCREAANTREKRFLLKRPLYLSQ